MTNKIESINGGWRSLKSVTKGKYTENLASALVFLSVLIIIGSLFVFLASFHYYRKLYGILSIVSLFLSFSKCAGVRARSVLLLALTLAPFVSRNHRKISSVIV